MIQRKNTHGLVWVDMANPSKEEVEKICDEFHIDTHTEKSLLQSVVRPRVEIHPAYIYTVFHFPLLHETCESECSDDCRLLEVDCVIGPKFLITAHTKKTSLFFESREVLAVAVTPSHAGDLFLSLMHNLYRSLEHDLDSVRRSLSLIESKVFAGEEWSMVGAISKAGRDILDIRHAIEPHRELWRLLEDKTEGFFGRPFRLALKIHENEFLRLQSHLTRAQESLRELRETNNSLLTTKQNEVMRIFTIMAFMTFPLTLVATLLAADLPGNPISHHPLAFWIVTDIVAISAILMAIYFKKKHWL